MTFVAIAAYTHIFMTLTLLLALPLAPSAAIVTLELSPANASTGR